MERKGEKKEKVIWHSLWDSGHYRFIMWIILKTVPSRLLVQKIIYLWFIEPLICRFLGVRGRKKVPCVFAFFLMLFSRLTSHSGVRQACWVNLFWTQVCFFKSYELVLSIANELAIGFGTAKWKKTNIV